MQAGVRYGIVGVVCAAVAGLVSVTSASAQQSQVERGKYLVTLGSCTDCHTPGYFFGKPDMATSEGRRLGSKFQDSASSTAPI